jgi:hypothetical protein
MSCLRCCFSLCDLTLLSLFFFSISATAAAAAGRPCGALEALRQDESHNCSDYAMQKMRHTEQHQL